MPSQRVVASPGNSGAAPAPLGATANPAPPALHDPPSALGAATRANGPDEEDSSGSEEEDSPNTLDLLAIDWARSLGPDLVCLLQWGMAFNMSLVEVMRRAHSVEEWRVLTQQVEQGASLDDLRLLMHQLQANMNSEERVATQPTQPTGPFQ